MTHLNEQFTLLVVVVAPYARRAGAHLIITPVMIQYLRSFLPQASPPPNPPPPHNPPTPPFFPALTPYTLRAGGRGRYSGGTLGRTTAISTQKGEGGMVKGPFKRGWR
jgi:hypothetical protein